MSIQLKAAALSDPGRKRNVNEDTVYQKIVAAPDEDTTGLFIVADGIGGRMAGQAASFWAVEAVKTSLSDLIDYRDPRTTHRFNREELLQAENSVQTDPHDLQDRVLKAVARANNAIREYARQKPEEALNAGTTLSMVLTHGLAAVVANVGDSRTYLLRGDQLRQITKDHSLIQRLIDAGEVHATERYDHPQRNLIYRSLGADDVVEADIFPLTLAAGDFLLLCTDGLWEMIRSPTEIAQLIQDAPGVEVACQQLVAAANAAGGEDNIAVVLAHVSVG